MPNIPNTTQNGLALISAGDGQNSTVFWSGNHDSKTYAVSSLIAVPSGATNFLPPFFLPVPAGQTWFLVGVRAMIRAGTSATMDIQQNGVGVGGLTGIVVTTTAATTLATTPSPVVDGDYFAPVFTAISGTPDGLSLSFYFQVTP